ncbi:MAG: alanine aminotransferase, partial [Methanopyri archaeon]|nr:alanine aminotransferase [Methanopyri archaeon]
MINPTERSANIEYAIRDVLIPALKLEEQGRTILKLNIGDPIAFDFETPTHMVEAYCRALRDGHNGYSDSQGYKPLISSIVD